jgi:archaemetzincin
MTISGLMKSFIFIIGLIIFTAALIMAFEPLTNKETLLTIGSTNELPDSLQRALSIDDFEPIPSPRPGDWLAEHHEDGQTFDEFVQSDRNSPDEIHNVIYLQPIGQFRQDQSPSLDLLREYATAYFLMDVDILPTIDIRRLDLTIRLNPYSQNRQLLTEDILRNLRSNLLGNAFCVLAVTMEDLYPDPRWNFVFGQASLRDRVGVFSFARYDPVFYGEPRGSQYQQLLLRRSAKVLVHETAHMYSLAHCIYFKCVMNGSNHLQESDSRPLSLCPVCLRKLQSSIQFDLAARYHRLKQFYRNIGFISEQDWVTRRLKKIEDSNHGQD